MEACRRRRWNSSIISPKLNSLIAHRRLSPTSDNIFIVVRVDCAVLRLPRNVSPVHHEVCVTRITFLVLAGARRRHFRFVGLSQHRMAAASRRGRWRAAQRCFSCEWLVVLMIQNMLRVVVICAGSVDTRFRRRIAPGSIEAAGLDINKYSMVAIVDGKCGGRQRQNKLTISGILYFAAKYFWRAVQSKLSLTR